MRVLLLSNRETRELAVAEIIHAEYSNDFFESISDGNISQGFIMFTIDGDALFIPDMNQLECDRVCRQLAETGYADLSLYEEYEIIE